LRVGPVGYGLAGAASHAPLIATTDGPVLDAVVTANPQRHADASAALPGERIAVLEAAAASAREGRTVQLDGGGG
jgi:scyllo-inositol 2-dehydrogenase (NADP+)